MRSSKGFGPCLCALVLAVAALAPAVAVAQSVTLSAPASSSTQIDTVTTQFWISDPAGTPQQIQVVFTCTGGPCASLPATVFTLTMKANTPTPGAFSVRPLDMGNVANVYTSTPAGVSMTEGVYSAYCQYVRPASVGGTTVKSTTRTNVAIDVVTRPPTLTLPAADTAYASTLPIDYVLSEGYLSGSATLTFTGPVTQTYTLANSTPTGSFTVNPANVANAKITASTGNLVDGTYAVVLSYQDRFSHPRATATNTGVVIDRVTLAPTVTVPVTQASYGTPLTVLYALPEAPLAGSVHLTLEPGGHVVQCDDARTGSCVVDETIPDGLYEVGVSYQDALGNAAASATVANVTLVNPDLTIAVTHSGDFTHGDMAAVSTITVSNIGAATHGSIWVADTLPVGLTAIFMLGEGWTCDLATLACLRTTNDVLAAGGAYPPITLVTSVADDAPILLINTVTVAGGGELNIANNEATDTIDVNCRSGTYLMELRCQPCGGACPAGQFLGAACTPIANRVCSQCTPIVRCDQVACSTAGDQRCTVCSEGAFLRGGACPACGGACPAGQYVSAACTADDDRVCSPCARIAGCAAETCTTGADSVCATCEEGHYRDAGSCKACSGACPAGQFLAAACAADADRVCQACASVANCDSVTCTTDGDSRCVACADGYFGVDGACVACSGACPAGEVLDAACSASADRVCIACDSTCATCGATAADCTGCAEGRFLEHGHCIACTACAPGSRRTEACTASTDTVCTPCAPGTSSWEVDATECTACEVGTFAGTAGSVFCQPCLAGTFSQAGQNTCSECMDGTVAPSALSPSCTMCAAGTIPNPARTECVGCPAGTAAEAGVSACTACLPGRFAAAARAGTCVECPAGAFAAGPGATACTPCAVGTFASETGSTACGACPAGEFVGTTGAATCVACGGCDDSDECTTDGCDPAAGCTHTRIDGCVVDQGPGDEGTVSEDVGTTDPGTPPADVPVTTDEVAATDPGTALDVPPSSDTPVTPDAAADNAADVAISAGSGSGGCAMAGGGPRGAGGLLALMLMLGVAFCLRFRSRISRS